MEGVPNLFILGSAKCGTTSLHSILGQHPDIHASSIKEPTFFNWPFQVVQNPIEYFQLFDSAKRYRMESSGAYMTNPETARVLRSLFPGARFIISLRNPKSRAYSLYRNMLFEKFEQVSSFAEALKVEASRFSSWSFFTKYKGEFWDYQYCRSSLYDEQLARYFSLFDRTQFHILTLAELSKEPVATIERILRFLNVDPSPARTFDFAIQNRNESYAPYDAESDRVMSVAFEGLIERTERLVGRPLDWSV